MATSKTSICNWAMLRVGEDIFTDVDADGTTTADKVNAIWDLSLENILDNGPEKGWQFAARTYHGVDRDSITIASIAQSSNDDDYITVTGTHALIVGDEVMLDDTEYDDTYDVEVISTTATFDVEADFVATDTGTAYWTSEEYGYRYARPTCTRVTSVKVGGTEIADWVRKGSYILTNLESDEVDMDYILGHAAATVLVANFPAHFVNALRLKLATDLAYDLVQNSALGERLYAEYEKALAIAIGMDNREKYAKESSNAWIAAGHTTTNIE